ncbi:MAG TPA: hypothetical protein VHU81_03255 [Thermoanaerobaculia bacterium]|nr:hypothetical protein [Thermoanaerobaculia bacterium]
MSSDPRSLRRPGKRVQVAGLALAAALPLLLVSLAGCGKQGPPAPPYRAVPAPLKDLTVRQRGNQILLGFTYPKLTPAGAALGDVTGLQVWAAERPAPREGQPQPLDARELNAVATERLALKATDLPGVTYGDHVLVTLPLSEPVQTRALFFVVRTLGPKGDRSDPSNQVVLVPKAPPAAPQQVTTTPVSEGIQVEWSTTEGAAGYNVYRRGSQERVYTEPMHTAGPTETTWVDSSAQYGQSYIYAVTALAERTPAIESAIGSEHEVRYQDRFAPPAPEQLVALAEEGQVRLFWKSSNAGDLAGYLVYRRAPGGEFTRLTPQPQTSLELTDRGLRKGQTFTYRVTAVDATGNESTPSNEVQANVP